MLDLATLLTLEWVLLPAVGGVVLLGLLAGIPGGWLRRRRFARLEEHLQAANGRQQAADQQIWALTAQVAGLQERLEDLSRRQTRLATADARNGVRQAIALTRHGASARQLVDACGLSHGEAHLVQSLYGRPGQTGPANPERH